MLTGTKAKHDGFGTNVKGVTHVLTLYNVNTEAVLRKWDRVKKRGQMYDLVNWNCARAVLNVINEGYANCAVPESALWTPESAFDYLKQMNSGQEGGDGVLNSKTTISPELVRSRQIEPSTGISIEVVLAIVLAVFFGALMIAVVIAVAVVMVVKSKARQQLDQALARLLLSATARKQSAGDNINQQVDTNGDGQVSQEEFAVWAKENRLTPRQRNILWKDLDINKDKVLSTEEWDDYIEPDRI